MATLAEKETEFLYRVDAIQRLAPYIEYTCPAYIRSSFSDRVCAALRAFVDEITAFPAVAHDDQVDAMTQALRRLYPLHQRMKISQAALDLFSRESHSRSG